MKEYYFGSNNPGNEVIFSVYNRHYLPDEKKDIDYDEFFKNKKYIVKDKEFKTDRLNFINIIHHSNLNEEVDCRFIDEIMERFPYIFEKRDKREKFWNEIKMYTTYSKKFFWKNFDNLGVDGMFSINDLTEDYILEYKNLFKSKKTFRTLFNRSLSERLYIEFSEQFIEYFPIFEKEDRGYEIENFLEKNWLRIDFVEKLIKEHGWKDIFKFYYDYLKRGGLHPQYLFLTVKYSDDEVIPIGNDDELYMINKLGEFVSD